jgi:AraC-like DNA-binding protein
VDYQERQPSDELQGLVKAFWTLDVGGTGKGWIEHRATPDGCIEVIQRERGRSRWGTIQPARFAVGLNESPVTFEMTSDARFAALRLWPWTWRAIGGPAPLTILGRWIDVGDLPLAPLLNSLANPEAAEAALLDMLGSDRARIQDIGAAILGSETVAEMSARSGMPPRRLQRWFTENVGLAPRTYLRLLRFQTAFEQLPDARQLADHAAMHGFADQSHMARDFRQMAGDAASRVKDKARGPFLR